MTKTRISPVLDGSPARRCQNWWAMRHPAALTVEPQDLTIRNSVDWAAKLAGGILHHPGRGFLLRRPAATIGVTPSRRKAGAA